MRLTLSQWFWKVWSCLSVAISLNRGAFSLEKNESRPIDTPEQHPAYNSHAGCICDMQESYCDPNCCCDQDCSPESIKAFKCATMMPTAPDAWVFSRYNCSEPKKRFFPSELYFLLCLSRVNTPYLGHFYEKKSVVRGLSEFGDLMRSGGKQTRFVGSDQQQNIKQLNTLQTSTVTYGGGIKLINFQGKDGGFLSLPGEIIPGTCGPSVPIQYLLDSNSLCSVVITQSSCTKDPKLQPSFYLTSLDANLFSSADNITNDNETTESPTVDTQTTPKISVKYLCYQSEILSECSSVSLGAPTYNTARKMCEKAVMEVKYDLYWNASRITNVNAEIIIGDLMEAPTFMRFSVRFYHHEKLLSPVENASLPKRSGNPGYDVGRPLIAVRKNLDGKMSYSDVNQLQSWRPGANGLCESAKLNRLNFLEDVDSTCYLPLTQWDFNNCTNLWNTVKSQLDRTVNVTHISRYGTVQSFTGDSFIGIIRQQSAAPAYNCSSSTAKLKLPYHCANMVYHIEIEIIYENPYELEQEISEISGIYIHYRNRSLIYESANNMSQLAISSSVRFLRAPLLKSPKTKRYYLRETRDHCPSDVTCWDELFYPFLQLHLAYDFKYSLSFGLAFIMFICASLYIKPWR